MGFGDVLVVFSVLGVVPVSARNNRAIMRLPSCRIPLSDRKEDSHDALVPHTSRRATESRRPTVCPVAAQPDHATRAHPQAVVGAGDCPHRALAARAGGQAARSDPTYVETAPGRNRRGRLADSPTVLPLLCGSAGSCVAHADGGGRGPAGRWDPATDHL
jgi:hypothetical protein